MNNRTIKKPFPPTQDSVKPGEAIACLLYDYNDELAYRPILLHRRVLEWYKGDGIDCHAIQNQRYLEPGNIRNDTLEAVMRRDHISQIDAIQKIIFQHTIPFPIIKAIVTYGTIIQNDESITITSPMQINNNPYAEYFIAEITGKICNDHIKIWHTFLRITSYDNAMTELLEQISALSQAPTEIVEIPPDIPVEYLMQQMTQQERSFHQAEDSLEGFSSPITTEQWEINDTTACVTVTHENDVYTLFKQ